MALVAGGVALSLVVTTPSNAQAFVIPPVVLPAVFGSTAMAIPELMATSTILGPVGWGIAGVGAAALIGYTIYSNRETIWPINTGDLGKASPSCNVGACFSDGSSGTFPTASPSPSASASPSPSATTAPAPVTYAEPGFTVKTAPADGLIIHATFAWANTGSSTGYTAIMQAIGSCRNNSTGAVSYGLKTITQGQANRTTSREQLFDIQPCPGGYTMTGYMVGGGYPSHFNADGSAKNFQPNVVSPYNAPVMFSGNTSSGAGTHGPANVLSFGTFAPGDTDPKTHATKYTTSVECINTDGSKATITRDTYGDEKGLIVPSCGAAGLGHATGKMDVNAFLNGSPTPQKIWSATAPTPTADKPLCAPTRSTQGCKLAIKIDGKECAMGVAECVDWSSLNRDPNWTPRISCQYGPYVVPTSTCNPIEQAYEPGGAPTTDPNTDGDPGTRDDTQPDGNTYPRPSTDPNAPPATGTTPGTVPGGAGAPAPSAPGTPQAQAECWPNGWAALNPLEWVLKPIGCAFIPTQDISKLNQDVVNKTGTKAPVAWLTQPMIAPSGGGCPNWVVNVGSVHQNVVCDSSYTSALRAVRGPLFLLVATAMVWPLLRSLWYAAIPILRVTPSSGGK
jgi:hypothetical protein